MPELTSSELEWATEHFGDLADISFCGTEHAQSAVWRLSSSDQSNAFLKRLASSGKYRRERDFYRHCGSALESTVPRLLACRDELPGLLLLSALPGRPVSELAAAEPSAYGQAGAWLARLHGLPIHDIDPMPLAEAVGLRWKRVLDRAKRFCPPDVLAEIQKTLAALVDRADRRVYCHRDYSARNWLLDSSGRLGVIDFEHARADWALLDLQKVRVDTDGQPDCWQAFLTGYRASDREALEEDLDRTLAVYGLATLLWARDHNDGTFFKHGLRALQLAGCRWQPESLA